MFFGKSQPEDKSEGRGLSLPASLPPRHPDCQITDHESVARSGEPRPMSGNQSAHVPESEKELDIPSAGQTTQIDDPFYDLVGTAMSPPRIDVIKEVENESETSSSLYVFDMQEQNTNHEHSIKRDNSMSAASECTGPLAYSMDELQYSTTNGTSFSQQSRTTPVSPCQSFGEQSTQGSESCERAAPAEAISEIWTSFDDAPPFQDDGFTDDFGFDTFVPFESDVAKQSRDDEEIDAAWDTSKVIPASASPISPASVFHFFTEGVEDADDDDDDVVGSEAAGLWAIGDGEFRSPSQVYIETQASF